MKSELVEVDVKLRHETANAYLVDYGGKKPVWLPKSQCQLDQVGNKQVLSLPQWLALEKELI